MISNSFLESMATDIFNSLTPNQAKFFFSSCFRVFITRQIAFSAVQSNSINKLTALDSLFQSFLSKISNPSFLKSILDDVDTPPIIDDFDLESIPISSYITNAIKESDNYL